MRNFFHFIKYINPKTIYFNFKYLKIRQAVKLPVLVSKNVSLNAVLGRVHLNCQLKTGLVKIGFGNVGIFDKRRSKTIWEVYGDVTFEGNAMIGHGSKIVVGEDASLIFGENLKVTAESSIVAFKRVQIGNNCLLSWDTLLMDTDFHKVKNDNGEIINCPQPIIIGDHVWIGCRSVILKGSVIPNNSIVAINSLVNKELLIENCIYGGSPVKCLRENISWEE
jgi:acetyltransferase-like isoleucine patch superfamily enzyme